MAQVKNNDRKQKLQKLSFQNHQHFQTVSGGEFEEALTFKCVQQDQLFLTDTASETAALNDGIQRLANAPIRSSLHTVFIS
ncbi:hypothetical protein RRSWK_00091 [Rhodopirellula sp. SWK7]|nr:hypothetical protein RRSWK_00091 [Rhodopirellula sp. SWK7]